MVKHFAFWFAATVGVTALQAGAASAGTLLPVLTDPLCGPSNSVAILRPAPPQAAGTRRMVERLARIRETADPRANPFLNTQVAEIIRKMLASTTNWQEEVTLRYRLGIQFLQAGQPENALVEFQNADKSLERVGKKFSSQSRSNLRMHKAVALMRLGEQENCLTNHNAQSCLFPIQPEGYHQLQRGSRGAVMLFSEQLREFPNDLRARWLLNLAHMTLGEYPDKVSPEWLIPPKAFASEYPLPRFPDVAGALGVDVNDLAGGCILDDFDNDGFIDIVASGWGLNSQLRYLHNDGNGRFTERTRESGLTGLVGGLNIQQTDYNNDGLLDIWVLRGGWLGKPGRMPNSLLRNNGDGTFTDVTEEANLLSFHPTQTSVWFDYDGDGWLDLFIGNETLDAKDPDPCELYHNNRDGTFTERASLCGLAVKRFIKGVTCADYDHDGRPDLYISCLQGPNLLFHNDGPAEPGPAISDRWNFTEVSQKAGVGESVFSFPTWFFDYDNDGWEDLFVSAYSLRDVGDIAADYLGQGNKQSFPKLYHNNQDGTFSDVTSAMHLNHSLLSMGCNFGDLDNDGWLDFYVGTGDPDLTMVVPNRMFRNAEGKFFQDVTTAGGFGHLQKGHAVGFADLDNDGDQDIYTVIGGAFEGDGYPNALFLNPGTTNHWLKLKLVGKSSNRPAIGARIQVTVTTPEGTRRIFKTVNSGGSFGSSPFRQEIGLGNATGIVAVDISWPTMGIRQHLTDLALDSAYQIQEGEPRAVIMNLKRLEFDLKTSQGHQHDHIKGM